MKLLQRKHADSKKSLKALNAKSSGAYKHDAPLIHSQTQEAGLPRRGMRVALFTDTFLPQVNGVVTCVVHLAEELGRQGHHVLVICPQSPKKKKTPFNLPNVDVLYLTSVPAFLYPDFRIGLLPKPELLKKISAFKPDVIHLHTALSVGLLALAVSKVLRVSLVGTNHLYLTRDNDDFVKSLNRNPHVVRAASGFIRLYSKVVYDLCNLTIVPSKRLLKALKDEGYKGRILSLPNPICLPSDRSLNSEKREKLRSRYALQPLVVIHAGRLSVEKNVDAVLRAFAHLRKKRNDVSLLIIGDGPVKKELEKLTAQLQLKDRVHFVGFLPHQELLDSHILGLGDLFITASEMENQPMVVLEAMSFGLPIVGVRAAGMPDIVRNNGVLLEPGDEEGLAQAMQKILKSEALRRRLSQHSRAYAEEHEVSHVVKKLVELYESLKKKRG